MKRFRYFVEACLVSTLTGLFGMLPLDTASAIGGFVGRAIGANLAASRKAMRNLQYSLPGRSEAEYKAIIRGMWDNLGRTFAEYPHLEKLMNDRVEYIGLEHIKPLVGTKDPAIFFTGHLANWEIAGPGSLHAGVPLDLIYRAPNNKYVDTILQKYRSLHGKIQTYPKSSQGMRDIMSALKSGRRIGILIDQKYNQGLAMPFFGRIAMTSPAFAQLAQKFDCLLLPAQVERLDGAHFRLTINPPLPTKGRDITDIVNEAHSMLEKWITMHPEQWLWLHKRWKENNEI